MNTPSDCSGSQVVPKGGQAVPKGACKPASLQACKPATRAVRWCRKAARQCQRGPASLKTLLKLT